MNLGSKGGRILNSGLPWAIQRAPKRKEKQGKEREDREGNRREEKGGRKGKVNENKKAAKEKHMKLPSLIDY